MQKQLNKIESIALIPDRFAAYRYNVFRALSDYRENGFRLEIYADTEEDIKGLRLVDRRYCDQEYSNGGISWVRIKNIAYRGVCFWQTGLMRLVFFGDHQLHVYWGEAHRISTWLSVLLSKMCGKKVVFWTHGIYGNEGFLKLLIRRQFYRLADALLLYSDYGKGVMVQCGFESRSLHVIKNSLDTSRQNELYEGSLSKVASIKSKYFSKEDRVLLFVGRLEPQKKLEMLLEALCLLKKQGRASYKLLLIGDGSERTALAARSIELGVEGDVIFYGACYDDEILAPMIMMADICVSPGEVGLTAMHSLIYGTPVVTHDNFAEQMPEFEAIIPGDSGAFYRYGDVGDLSVQIANVLSLIDNGEISAERCRRPVLQYYNEDFQLRVFKGAVEQLS